MTLAATLREQLQMARINRAKRRGEDDKPAVSLGLAIEGANTLPELYKQ